MAVFLTMSVQRSERARYRIDVETAPGIWRRCCSEVGGAGLGDGLPGMGSGVVRGSYVGAGFGPVG